MTSAIALTDGTSQGHNFVRCIFHVHPRCDESAVDVAVIPSQTSHHNQLLTYFIGILGIDAWRRLVISLVNVQSAVFQLSALVEIVVVQTGTSRETVMLVEVCFKQ